MIRFDSHQLHAIATATRSRLTIITGGAGTGKTSIVAQITRELKAAGEDVRLIAFAGKAAARLREACKHPSSTIHRLLQYDGTGFRLETLEGLTIIMDESSMVSADLMAEVMRRNPKRVILVGDQAQLPPVGKGQPFHDLLTLRPDLVCNLTTCYRATEAVYQAANAIRKGNIPPAQLTSPNESWRIMATGSPEKTQAAIMRWVNAGAIDFQQDVILVPRNGEGPAQPATVEALNAAIAEYFRPGTEPKNYEPGDRVMNTKNLPELDVWNGTAGTVHAVDIDGGVWVQTDVPVIDKARTKDDNNPVYTDKVLFSKTDRKHLQLAYALSVHKSQGSQYRRVIFVCLSRDSFALLDRSLIYTAVTRTQQGCVVCGDARGLASGVERVRGRRTVLQEIEKGDE
jgi:exodeoxyribonuclease V alpha subunit